jgi:hypothetical protein
MKFIKVIDSFGSNTLVNLEQVTSIVYTAQADGYEVSTLEFKFADSNTSVMLNEDEADKVWKLLSNLQSNILRVESE